MVEDLLKEGKRVYVKDIDDVRKNWEDDLVEDYDDNIIFVKALSEVHEKTWRIDL